MMDHLALCPVVLLKIQNGFPRKYINVKYHKSSSRHINISITFVSFLCETYLLLK